MLIVARDFATSMAGRIFAVLMAGIVAAAVVAALVAGLQRRDAAAGARIDRIADRIATALASEAPVPGVHRVAVTQPEGNRDARLTQALRDRGGALLGATAWTSEARDCQPAPPPPGPAGGPPGGRPEGPGPGGCFIVALPGNAFAVDAPPVPDVVDGLFGAGFFVALALAAVALSLIVARMAARPIAGFAVAADGLSRDLDAPPLATAGPSDVRRAITAFNTMQQALQRNLVERSHMLAAISHDLRTPLTRMRLRIDRVADADLRDRLIADAAAMRDLIEQGLDLARTAEMSEPRQRVDLAALVGSIVDDAADAGQPVRLAMLEAATLRTHPNAVQRIIVNLIDNAVEHGGSATVSLVSTAAAMRIEVADRGPGIPLDQIETVFDPFRRLDPVRSGDGGTGLGLTIAKALAVRIGGQVSVRNRAGGGVRAVLTLPHLDSE